MNGTQSLFFFALPSGALRRGQKVKYRLISITKSISKVFIPNFLCVLTNERYKTYQTGFSLISLGHAPGVGLWGTGGAQVVKKKKFKHGQVKFSSEGQAGDLGVRSKVKYH